MLKVEHGELWRMKTEGGQGSRTCAMLTIETLSSRLGFTDIFRKESLRRPFIKQTKRDIFNSLYVLEITFWQKL